MSTITAILEPDSEGCLHLPVPEEMRGGKVKVVASLEHAGSPEQPNRTEELKPVSEDAARRVEALRQLSASMKARGVDFEQWKRDIQEARR